ncbi:MAG: DEAD/DEAH box helicase [bacterium]|nr:DEAD/DEAH box helicase [bacterium]
MIQRLFGNRFEDILNNDDSSAMDAVAPELWPLYAAAISKIAPGNLIWITGENENTDILKHHLEAWNAFLDNTDTTVHIHGLPWADPYIDNTIAPETAGEKYRLLADIKEKTPIIVITTLAELAIRIKKKKDIDELTGKITVNMPKTMDKLTADLSQLGYVEKSKGFETGDYTQHGNILDIFPAGYEYPFRIKIGNDKIQSIKRFHPVSRISIEAVESIAITTTHYFETTKSKHTETLGLTEMMDNCSIFAGDTDALREEYTKLLENFDNMRRDHREDESWPPVSDIFTFPVETLKVFDLSGRTGETGEARRPVVRPDKRTFLNMAEPAVTPGLFFCCGNKLKENTVKNTFEGAEIIARDIPVSLVSASGLETFISFHGRGGDDTFAAGQQGGRHIFDGIEPGDLVVHTTHGIGRFSGFKHLDMDGEAVEFLTIMYQGDAKIYVPVHEMDILSKYVGFGGGEPPLDKIGGATWETKKKEAGKNIVAFAQELLDLYAKRKAVAGFAFKMQREAEQAFIKEFSFVETRGQKAAIKEVLTDLAAPYPMDRLICGDVSFGKTEIALRAAIRVVSNGKQTAVLCPTTVLAHQHYMTFKKRFAALPYTIEILSRNVPAPQRKKILAGLTSGDIDMVIGTHALLGNAVEFKDPGLFIIDEEQRFGVFQKEKLKKGREYVDVLSLSATPIPRTLSFTIAGLQDVSIIDTPPVGRKAIKNYTGPYSEELMISAVVTESQRGGQTFVIYNNIEGIYDFTAHLQELLPKVSFALIHARMTAEEIEGTVFKFLDKQVDVLVSTTIIENGIDIPNVNTLIIMDAHNFGLTQLYQLRGRIGRGTQQAHAYFFHGNLQNNEGGRGLSAKADQRLQALREFTQLGAGYKVAEFDLKMRGAGSLLGNKQHGHIEALGFDYFLGLLKNTVARLRGEETEVNETDFSIQFSYSISNAYIPDTLERTSVYQRLLDAETAGELVDLKEELEDRYGEVEESVQRGFLARNVYVLARYFQFEEVELSLDSMFITLRPVYEDKKEALEEFFALSEASITSPTTVTIEYADYREFMETLELYLLDLDPPRG